MSNLAQWSLIVGFLMPTVVAVVQRDHWPNWARSLVMFASSLIAGAGTAVLQNHDAFTAKNWLNATLLVGVAAIASYHGFWKPTGVAPAIERATGKAKDPNA
jgi:hypothetical protein